MEANLARSLLQQGLTSAFGVTGSGASWRLISALEAGGARYYPASHEGSAAIMAGGALRASGRLSAAIGIKGPGLTNMLPGIAFNLFENLPVVSICEAYGPATPRYRMHKRIDQARLLSAACKGSISVADAPARLPALVQRARAEVPGPVHVDLCDGTGDSVPWEPAASAADAAQEAAFARAIELLEKSRRPLLIVGSLVGRRPDLAKLLGAAVPVMTTAAAKGLIDERAPNAWGVFTGDGKTLAPEGAAVTECDLVLGVGLRNLEVLSPKPFGRPAVLVDEAPAEVGEGFNAETTVAVTDAEEVARLRALLDARAWGVDRIRSSWERLDAAFPRDTWLPAACFHALNALPYDYTLALDTGSFCTIGEHLWRAGPRRLFLGSSNGRYMGGGLSTAIGAAAAVRNVPVICATGDGGMRMYCAEMRLAVSERLPVCVILMSDGRYGSIACTSNDPSMSRAAVEMPGAEWNASIRAMGCEAVVARDIGAFERGLGAWTHDAPLFIECRFAPEPYAVMTRDLR
jgi:acetolactate synthase-1/2/3 large subunit